MEAIGPIRIGKWTIARAKRSLHENAAALEILYALEKEWDSILEPNGYVYEEIAENLHEQGHVNQPQEYFIKA